MLVKTSSVGAMVMPGLQSYVGVAVTSFSRFVWGLVLQDCHAMINAHQLLLLWSESL